MAEVNFPFFVQRAVRLAAELMFSNKWEKVLGSRDICRTYDEQARLPYSSSDFTIAKVVWRKFERTGEREVTVYDTDAENYVKVTLAGNGNQWRIVSFLIAFKAKNDGKKVSFYAGEFNRKALAAM